MTDYKQLCAELLRVWDAQPLPAYQSDWASVVASARTALAQPEPEGPTPKEVSDWIVKCNQDPKNNRWTEHVSHHDALLIALAALHDFHHRGTPNSAKTRKSLGDAQGHPADGEVAELVETLKGIAYWKRHGKPGFAPAPFDIRQADRLERAASLLERQQPVPVAVSERLPGPVTKPSTLSPGGLPKGV